MTAAETKRTRNAAKRQRQGRAPRKAPVTQDAIQRDNEPDVEAERVEAADPNASASEQVFGRKSQLVPGVYLGGDGEELPDVSGMLDRYEDFLVEQARVNPAAFNEYVLRDELTGQPIKNGRHHLEWHHLISTHQQLVLWAHIESAKSAAITLGRVLWELGNNPQIRIAIVSETFEKAKKALKAIKQYITSSAELRRVFPNLRRSTRPGDPWSDRQIAVERDGIVRDPSVVITGAGGSIQGARTDWILLDDILSFRNTRTKAQRNKLIEWFRADLAGRPSRSSRFLAVGTAWHPEDLYHFLAKLEGWVSARYGVIGKDGQPIWPEAWPMDRIRAAEKRLGHIEAMRQLYVQPVSDSEQRCKEEYIDAALREGFGLATARTLRELLGIPADSEEPLQEALTRLAGEGAFITTGIDVASSMRKGKSKSGTEGSGSGGLTVAFTALHYPDGLHQIVSIEAGRMTGPEILALARAHHQQFGSLVFVENNGAQQFLLQFAAEGEYFPVLPHHTGANKWDPAFGVESLFVEMANGKWAFPNVEDANGVRMDPEVHALIADMRSYDPSSHTADRIMSMWICREGARRRGPQIQFIQQQKALREAELAAIAEIEAKERAEREEEERFGEDGFEDY